MRCGRTDSPNGKRATTILTRRVKQSVAEWYVLEILVKSWDGTCEHTRQGWNIGRAPYGYLAQRVPHPVPAKRAAGGFKSRLVLDEIRAPVVYQIFEWRTVEKLGYAAIESRLNFRHRSISCPNSDGPIPDPSYMVTVRSTGHSSKSQVHGTHGLESPIQKQGRQT